MNSIASLTRAPVAAASRPDVSIARAPRTIDETGLSQALLADLCAKALLRRGRSSLRALADHIKLPPSVLQGVLTAMRSAQQVEMVGHPGVDADAEYQLTEPGRAHAGEALNRNQYVGPAPVPLETYCDYVKAHSVRHADINSSYVRNAFRALVVDPAVVDQMGAAMNSGRAILVYGPAGSGKTFLAEHLASLQPDNIPVPYAVTVGGEIIQIFDPLIHEPSTPVEAGSSLVRADHDERWQWCRRPVVIAGGELTLPMLDLQFDPTTRYYQAPPHVKANGGVFVVDDLGRQLVAPRELMNRWIVPLDRNRDYLSLHSGFKFSVPFDMTVIFSTNLEPHELADEAFLRRFGYKVYLGPMDTGSYQKIFEETCRTMGVDFDATAFEWLLESRHHAENRALLACYPRDLIGRVRDFAVYEGHDRAHASQAALERAWATYFTTTGATDGSRHPRGSQGASQ